MGPAGRPLPRTVQVAAGVAAGFVLSVGIVAVRARLTPDAAALPPAGRRLLALVNDVRSGAHCPALRADPVLTRVAQHQATDMVARGFLSSVNPGNEDPMTRAGRYHYPGLVTEAYAAGLSTPDDVIAQWSGTTGPGEAVARRILNCSLVSAGIGFDAGTVVPRLGPHVWVLELGDH